MAVKFAVPVVFNLPDPACRPPFGKILDNIDKSAVSGAIFRGVVSSPGILGSTLNYLAVQLVHGNIAANSIASIVRCMPGNFIGG
jgi:hypothetical protein